MISSERAGLHLIEVLIVIAIIATLMGLLLPAVQKAREKTNEEAAIGAMRTFASAQSFEDDQFSPSQLRELMNQTPGCSQMVLPV